MKETTGMRIAEIRRSKKITQEEIANKLNVSFQAVSSWERDIYLPDSENLIKLAKILEVSVSYLVEDKGDYEFKTDKIFYNVDHMKTHIQTVAKIKKLTNTLKALPYAEEAHSKQKLKRADIPYFSHPLNMVCHLLAMNIDEDEILAAALLHDVIEDCGKKLEDLPVNDETKKLVELLTHEKDDSRREEILKKYYKGLSTNPKAALIKLVDRYNNLTKMSWGLSRDKIYRMIKETEIYVLPLLDVIKNTKYDDAKWLLSYQIKPVLDIYKRLM